MKKRNRWIALALTLALVAVGTGAALAASGDSKDPLVTLSYLEETAIPEIVEQVEKNTQEKQEQLSQEFAEEIASLQQNGGGSSGTSGAGYTLVTLADGQKLSLDVGCELMLRVGSASVQAATSPALIDIATAGTIDSGASLTKNHLYMATIADRTVTATGGTAKLLVRGGYQIVN
jgi:hypothetical protein